MQTQKTNDTVANKIDIDIAERRIKANIEAIKWVCSDKRGRRFIAQLLEEFGVKSSVYNSNGMEMARRAGKQETAFWLQELVSRSIGFEAYREIEKEDIDRIVGEAQFKKMQLDKGNKQPKTI